MSVPATRSLQEVLRAGLADTGAPLELILATGGTALTGGEANAYVNVVIQGVTVKVPKLRQATAPAVGGPAYLLQSKDFLLYIGTVTTT